MTAFELWILAAGVFWAWLLWKGAQTDQKERKK